MQNKEHSKGNPSDTMVNRTKFAVKT